MIEINKIYNADCTEILKQLPDQSIDLILTDPPYGIKMDKGILSRYGEAPETTKIYAGGVGTINRLPKKYLRNF